MASTKPNRLVAALPIALAAMAALLLAASSDPAPRATDAAVPADLATTFLVQAECTSRDGTPLPGVLPFDAPCQAQQPATPGPLAYRRLDWSGVQASDAVLLPEGAIAQTFDFGDAPRAFSRLDRGLGDGGDLIVLTPHGAGIERTEDGGAGKQWWRDPSCHDGVGWLLFEGEPAEGWQSRDGWLGRAGNARTCPSAQSRVHTRWRRTSHALPWTDRPGSSPRGTLRLDTILSEHFAGGPPPVADHMERFLFAAGLGKVMWERWEHSTRTRRAEDELADTIAIIEEDGRCPMAAEPPGPGWLRADCRVWMRFDRAGGDSLPWP